MKVPKLINFTINPQFIDSNGKLHEPYKALENLSYPIKHKNFYSSMDLHSSSMQSINHHNSLILNTKPEMSSVYPINNNPNEKIKKSPLNEIRYPLRYFENSTKLAFEAYVGSGKKNYRSPDIISKFSMPDLIPKISADIKAYSIHQKDFRELIPANVNLIELKILLESKQKEIDKIRRENKNVALQVEELQHEKETFEFSDEFIYKTSQKEKKSSQRAKVLEGSSAKGSYSQFSTRGSPFSWDVSSPIRISSPKKIIKNDKSPFISSNISWVNAPKNGNLSPIKSNDSTLEYDKRTSKKIIPSVGSTIEELGNKKKNSPRERGSVGVWLIGSQKYISQNGSLLKQVNTSKSLSPERTQSLPRSNEKIQFKIIRDSISTPNGTPYGKTYLLIF